MHRIVVGELKKRVPPEPLVDTHILRQLIDQNLLEVNQDGQHLLASSVYAMLASAAKAQFYRRKSVETVDRPDIGIISGAWDPETVMFRSLARVKYQFTTRRSLQLPGSKPYHYWLLFGRVRSNAAVAMDMDPKYMAYEHLSSAPCLIQRWMAGIKTMQPTMLVPEELVWRLAKEEGFQIDP